LRAAGGNDTLFDKLAFLSDHSKAHLPFLSEFVEMQTFAQFLEEEVRSGCPQRSCAPGMTAGGGLTQVDALVCEDGTPTAFHRLLQESTTTPLPEAEANEALKRVHPVRQPPKLNSACHPARW
jgi:hypothetical protein